MKTFTDMLDKDGNLTWRTFKVLCLIVVFATVMGALSSCNTDKPVYYLYVTDWDESSVSCEIRQVIGEKEIIVCVLDRYLDKHPEPQAIVEAINTQIGFDSPYNASIAYWRLVGD